jgi:hypothetical protein
LASFAQADHHPPNSELFQRLSCLAPRAVLLCLHVSCSKKQHYSGSKKTPCNWLAPHSLGFLALVRCWRITGISNINSLYKIFKTAFLLRSWCAEEQNRCKNARRKVVGLPPSLSLEAQLSRLSQKSSVTSATSSSTSASSSACVNVELRNASLDSLEHCP